MKRLPITGASLASPAGSEDELKRALHKLGVADAFDDAAVHKVYLKIAQIQGAWLAEQEAKASEPVAKALLATGKNLIAASALLSGRETGFRTHLEIQTTSQTARMLALDPTVGSLEEANQLVSAFRLEAARIGHASMVAYVNLSQKGANDGRTPLLWYDGFTAILLQIARKAGVEPKLSKNRISGVRSGWLFEAAQALEPFLDKYLRSPSAEACGKRLERGRKRLLRPTRQNPHAR
jgi:hypothetical protein